MILPPNSKHSKNIKIITPPDSLPSTELDILAVDLNNEDQQLLLNKLLEQDIDVNIWSWNSLQGHDPHWLLDHSKSVDMIVVRHHEKNPMVSMLISKTNSFYIRSGNVNILEDIAVNTVTNIKELPI